MADNSKVTAAVFKARFPELITDPPQFDSVITGYIDMACELSAKSRTAVLYLAAHILVLEQNERGVTGTVDGGSGEVTSETMNRKVIQYKTMAETERDVFYTRTTYGRMFLAFEKRSPARTLGMFTA